MITYFYDENSTKQRIHRLTRTMYKNECIISMICLVLGVYLFPLGIMYRDTDSIIVGGTSLIGAISISAYVFSCFNRFKKTINTTFQEYEKDGLLHYSFSHHQSSYTLRCIESEKEFSFTKSDIKRLIRKNGVIVIQLQSKQIVDLPDREDIYTLLARKRL